MTEDAQERHELGAELLAALQRQTRGGLGWLDENLERALRAREEAIARDKARREDQE